jgi:hypothetical protein
MTSTKLFTSYEYIEVTLKDKEQKCDKFGVCGKAGLGSRGKGIESIRFIIVSAGRFDQFTS